MASLHEAFKSLGTTEYSEVPVDSLKTFLSDAFSSGQLLVDSVPIPPPSNILSAPGLRNTNTASAAEITASPARGPPPALNIEVLQNEWKPVKINPNQNPLGLGVYKCNGKDGKGAWFARRSVHEGLEFAKWKKALEREFAESLKVEGGPGEGNIRGIGGERRVESKKIEGVGTLEVYLLSAQFPGPTTPRDFVTLLLTSDQVPQGESGERKNNPRQFMVISKPCIHPEAEPREGYVRGQYGSVEFIRELKPQKRPLRATTALDSTKMHGGKTTGPILGEEENGMLTLSPLIGGDLERPPPISALDQDWSRSDIRARGRAISVDWGRNNGPQVRPDEDDVDYDPNVINPVEWIMITRSDPGGVVPRFMIERGTPAAIVSDATSFLDWACTKDIEYFKSADETLMDKDQNDTPRSDHASEGIPSRHNNNQLHDSSDDIARNQIDRHSTGSAHKSSPRSRISEASESTDTSGLYGMVIDAATTASSILVTHAPTIIADHLPSSVAPEREDTETLVLCRSSSSSDSVSSIGSFASALEGYGEQDKDNKDGLSTETNDLGSKAMLQHEKELQKLEERKRKLDEKMTKQREKDLNKKSEGTEKEAEATRKAAEKYQRHVKREEERYKKEVDKIEKKKAKDVRKVEEKKKKTAEKDEKVKLMRELEEVKAEAKVLRKEKELLCSQVGELQAENTALAGKLG